MSKASVSIGNSHIHMPEAQAVSQPILGVIPSEYIDEPYIVKTRISVLPASEDGIILYVHSF